MKFLLPAAAFSAFLAVPAVAQDIPVPPDPVAVPAADFDIDGNSLTIGGAAVYLPDTEGSNDYGVFAAPGATGSYNGFSFQLVGNRFSADLIPDKSPSGIDFQAGPVAVLNLYRSSADKLDDPRVRALGDLDRAIELGGYVGVGKTGVFTSPYDRLSVSISYRKDVNDVHSSGIVSPTINSLTPLSTKAAVGIFASAERAEGGYARTYFGVTPAQSVASGLPVYNARGGWKNWTIGALGTVALTGDLLHGFKLVAGGTYTRLLNDFAATPVVSIAGDRDQWLGAVGLAYTF